MTKLCGFSFLWCVLVSSAHAASKQAEDELRDVYAYHCTSLSDINEHLPVLRQLASECSSVAEIGVRSVVSTWGILLGLSEGSLPSPSYVGIDIDCPNMKTLVQVRRLAKSHGIAFRFWQANDMTIDIEPTEMLFIDSLHTYCHLTYELEKFSSKVTKYIALHDTSGVWENNDDTDYHGDYSEYPPEINRQKRGLWLAVQDFLEKHPEWQLHTRYCNNNGLSILKRVAD
jgi:hypothetical protein